MTRPTPPPQTADTALEHLSSDGFLLFANEDGGYTIWARNQSVPTGTEEERL